MVASAIAACVALLAPSPAAAHDTYRKCVSDGSLSTHLCLKLTYDRFTDGNTQYVRLIAVHAAAYRDAPQVRIKRFKFGAVVLGRCLSGCGTLYKGKRLADLRYPALRKSYGRRVPWSRRYVMVGGASHQCGVALLKWGRGGGTYAYTADVCYGMPPDALSLQDRERGLR